MDEDWYRATSPSGGFGISLDGSEALSYIETYRPNESASPLACAQQYQFCYATPQACGPLAGFYDAVAGAFELIGIKKDDLFEKRNLATAEASQNPKASRLAWFTSILMDSNSDFAFILNMLGADALKSAEKMSTGLQMPLPLNQWQLDATHVWAISKAY